MVFFLNSFSYLRYFKCNTNQFRIQSNRVQLFFHSLPVLFFHCLYESETPSLVSGWHTWSNSLPSPYSASCQSKKLFSPMSHGMWCCIKMGKMLNVKLLFYDLKKKRDERRGKGKFFLYVWQRAEATATAASKKMVELPHMSTHKCIHGIFYMMSDKKLHFLCFSLCAALKCDVRIEENDANGDTLMTWINMNENAEKPTVPSCRFISFSEWKIKRVSITQTLTVSAVLNLKSCERKFHFHINTQMGLAFVKGGVCGNEVAWGSSNLKKLIKLILKATSKVSHLPFNPSTHNILKSFSFSTWFGIKCLFRLFDNDTQKSCMQKLFTKFSWSCFKWKILKFFLFTKYEVGEKKEAREEFIVHLILN